MLGRWLLLLVFVFGYFLTASRFEDIAIQYVFLNVMALLSCVILLSQLKGFGTRNIAVWVSLGIVLMVYFFRFYWIALDSTPIKAMLHLPAYNAILQDTALIEGFKLLVLFFSVFCFFSAILLNYVKNSDQMLVRPRLKYSEESYYFIAQILLFSLLPVMLVLGYVANLYHIGEMGADSGEALPYRLKGLIFYARFMLVPLLALLLIYTAERSGRIILSRYGILLLLLHGFMDMFIRNSRSGLLLCVLLIVFLIIVGGIKLRRSEKLLVGITTMLAIVMVPIITEYRYHRTVNDFSILQALTNSFNAVGGEGIGLLARGFTFIFFRIPGIEAIIAMVGLGAEPLGMKSIEVLGTEQGLTGYLTHVIYQTPIEWVTLAAPSYIGWFYLVSGWSGLVVAGILVPIFIVVIWKYISDRYLLSSPIAKTFFLWMLFIALTEGTIDLMIYMFLVGIICIAVIETGMILIEKYRRHE